MTTRAQRRAKSPKIEALIGQDRELLKELVKESVQEVLEAEMTDRGGRPGRRAHGRAHGLPVWVLQPGAGDPDWETGAAGAPGPRRPLLDGAV